MPLSREPFLLCPPIIKFRGALCHGQCVGVHKHLVSVNYRTNAWVDWSDFSVAYWGWLEEGSFRWSAPPLIQDGRYGCHLGFGFRRLQDKRLGRLIRFFCGQDLASIDFLTNAWVDWSDFWWLIGGKWRKVVFDDHSSNMAAMAANMAAMAANMAATAAILDLVSIDYLTNARRLVRFFGASLGVINLHHVPLLPKPYHPYTHRQRPNRGHMPRLPLSLFKNGDLAQRAEVLVFSARQCCRRSRVWASVRPGSFLC
jgi:hypothetical protein